MIILKCLLTTSSFTWVEKGLRVQTPLLLLGIGALYTPPAPEYSKSASSFSIPGRAHSVAIIGTGWETDQDARDLVSIWPGKEAISITLQTSTHYFVCVLMAGTRYPFQCSLCLQRNLTLPRCLNLQFKHGLMV